MLTSLQKSPTTKPPVMFDTPTSPFAVHALLIVTIPEAGSSSSMHSDPRERGLGREDIGHADGTSNAERSP